MGELIRIDDLTIAYPLADGEIFRALRGVSMTIGSGQIVGIVGESGAGKSTIGKTALGLLEENARVEGGSVRLEGQALENLPEPAFKPIRGKRIGYIYQNPMTALNPVLTIGEQLIETIEAHTDRRGETARDYAIELLEQAEVPEAEDRLSKYPHQMSGGLCQRVVFAIAICAKPDLIIADEPTTALDVTVQKAVLDTLKRMAQQDGIAVILITHDMGVVAEMCDYVYVLRHGQLVEHGASYRVLGAPQERYSRELMAAIPRVDLRLQRFAVPGKLAASANRDRALQFLLDRGRATPNEGAPLLSVRNLSETFVTPATLVTKAKHFRAVDNVSFDVLPGETLGIVGESGSGKSTIGKLILGLHEPDDGAQISYRGRNFAGSTSRADQLDRCRSMQCIFQDPYSSLNPRMSAGDNITRHILNWGATNPLSC